MRQYGQETEARVAFLRQVLKESGAKGFVYGNSGGKDSALAGILCKKACDNTLGVILPCHSRRNYEGDRRDALAVAERFRIETRTVDLTGARDALTDAMQGAVSLPDAALSNLAPRLRMTALYAIAAAEHRLVVGTGNRSETYMGYFTKWGDGAYDVNPIADLTATETIEFLRALDAPLSIIEKAPSAGLYEGQTDEKEMGVTYAAIDRYLETGEAAEADLQIIRRYHEATEHKRRPALVYPGGRTPA